MVTSDLQAAIETVAKQGRMDEVPPILAFQSVVDDTVSTRGVMSRLFDRLDGNGSELVLFDVNRTRVISPMLIEAKTEWPREILRMPARNYKLTILGVKSEDDASIVERSRPARSSALSERAAGLVYPSDVYSLSHVALPFPPDDLLYGNHRAVRKFVQLGSIAVRGERNTLLVSQDSLSRLSYNPFYSYMAARITEPGQK
jgi:alpha-beta hydrolase superfamily lysophospholipase